ncbi:MAG TPA: DNA translocase FtsK 4TM domain-containing protein [Gaiellaceae bacterium]|nr:DNA translocase FtsK 4TM domain-containing protein [Gaiellaceae bacterium]
MAAKKRPAKVRPRTPARVRKKTRRRRTGAHQHPELIGLGLVAIGLFLGAVVYAGWNGGYVGGAIGDGFVSVVGGIAYLLPIAAVAIGALMIARSDLPRVGPFRTGLVVTTLGLALVLGSAHGGYLGQGLQDGLGRLIGSTGTQILGVFLVLAGMLLITGASAGAIVRRSGLAVRSAARRPSSRRRRAAEPVPDAAPAPSLTLARPPAPIDGVEAFPDVVAPAPLLVLDPEPELEAEPVDDGQTSLFDVAEADDDSGVYTLPDPALLRRSKPAARDTTEASGRVAGILVQALSNFGVDATVVGEIAGPRVTRYELQLAPGTKVSKVAGLKDDLSYALATTEIRILAPIPGKQAVGVEVPNHSPNLVTLGDIYDGLPATSSPLSVWLGKDISGNAVWADLARMPHLLIAGTTGSGKSGCINTILTSILLRATPDDVRMILIDPKRIELNYYESIPHLLTPVVSSPKTAAAALANVVGEMERRYERMSQVRARSLPEMNRALRGRGEKQLPYLLVVIDELADLMMISPQEVEDAVIRLAQKSRAVGIHLVLATQRPSVDVITGMIKANVPSRIAFAVSSQTDSRVILDQAGAESLLGQGDMLFKPLGTSRLQRVQGAYVSEEEVALVVEQCRAQREQELDESMLEAPESGVQVEEDEDGDFDPDEDPLLEKAIEVVVQAQTASVSLLQRRLRVGYTRAGRLIDMLERRGIISPYEGSKPRRVLIGETETLAS